MQIKSVIVLSVFLGAPLTENTKIKIPHFESDELNPKVLKLLEIIQQMSEVIQQLRDEIADLKGHKRKPPFKPSRMEKETTEGKEENEGGGLRHGSSKKSKTENLVIHETVVIPPKLIPDGSVFKGHKEYFVQGLRIETHNTLYKLERWQTSSGLYVEGELPSHIVGHFDLALQAYILYQYNQCHVTQPRLLEQLLEFGIDISSGQVDHILSNGRDEFHEEKKELLSAGLKASDYIQVDDTGARHDGKNGYCTVICNDYFTWFGSTCLKSRINFLELLRGNQIDYVINEEALTYMREEELPPFRLKQLRSGYFQDIKQWHGYLNNIGAEGERHRRILTEGALVGSLFHHGFNPDLVILSDDAGQFNIFSHALCWIHAERIIHKLVPLWEGHRTDLENVRKQIWSFYKELKAFKLEPSKRKKRRLDRRFDTIFTQTTCFATLNCALKRLHKNKKELLLVLDRPKIPLHNNGSERDIREFVTRRKISGGTRHERGKKARDTFTSLKKTCRKLGVSFWLYLLDRLYGKKQIPYLPNLLYTIPTAT